jgi:hypothetical protein
VPTMRWILPRQLRPARRHVDAGDDDGDDGDGDGENEGGLVRVAAMVLEWLTGGKGPTLVTNCSEYGQSKNNQGQLGKRKIVPDYNFMFMFMFMFISRTGSGRDSGT